jgi:hypothetical protein
MKHAPLYVMSYVTKDVLRHGVRALEVRACNIDALPHFRDRADNYYAPRDVHATKRQAAERAEAVRLERLAELRREIETARKEQRRLEAMCFLAIEGVQ